MPQLGSIYYIKEANMNKATIMTDSIAAIVHTNVPEQAEQLRKIVVSRCQCAELYVAEALGATAAKNGRGLIHLGFYGGD